MASTNATQYVQLGLIGAFNGPAEMTKAADWFIGIYICMAVMNCWLHQPRVKGGFAYAAAKSRRGIWVWFQNCVTVHLLHDGIEMQRAMKWSWSLSGYQIASTGTGSGISFVYIQYF
jgi:hypothetical protein